MLLLSCLLVVLSGGLSLLTASAYVFAGARRASSPFDPARRRVLVLGQRLTRTGQPSAAYAARLDAAAALIRRGASSAVLLGGATRRGCPSEAAAGRAYLRRCGVSAERIATEERSRHTLENLRHYRASFGPDGAAPALVTSGWHMARASLMARALGIAHLPHAPACTGGLAALRHLPAEAFLLHWYVTGRAFARFGGRRRMLARIS